MYAAPHTDRETDAENARHGSSQKTASSQATTQAPSPQQYVRTNTYQYLCASCQHNFCVSPRSTTNGIALF